MGESLLQKMNRHSKPTGYDNAGSAQPAPKMPVQAVQRAPAPRAIVPQYTQAQLQKFVAAERAKVDAAAKAAETDMDLASKLPGTNSDDGAEEPQGPSHAIAQAILQADEPVSEKRSETTAPTDGPVREISSYDAEVLEMLSSLDPAELMMNGSILREIEITDNALSATVKSLTKGDVAAIQRDIDEFRRGKLTDDGKRLEPFPDAVAEFSSLRQLSDGIVGVNGTPYPKGEWTLRAAQLEALPVAAYEAIRREYAKFSRAVFLLFPDTATKQHIERLKEALGKVRAHR